MANKRSDWEEYTLGQSGVQTGDLVNQAGHNDRRRIEEAKSKGGGGGGSGCLVLFLVTGVLLYFLNWVAP